jgi:hypothetical protein
VPVDAGADAAYYHGLLARLVEDPSRLTDGAPAGLDVRRLRALSGLITKVRHNPIRPRLALTLHALALAGAEMAFFASYAPDFTERRRRGIDDDERIALFATTLRQWLRRDDDAHRVVADCLDHELTLLAVSEAVPVTPPQRHAVVEPDSRPRRRDGVPVLHLSVDPQHVVEASVAGSGLADLDRAPRCYAYIPTPAGPRIKQVAPELAPVLDLANGSATITELAAELGVGSAVDLLAAAVQVFVHGGLVDIEPPCA